MNRHKRLFLVLLLLPVVGGLLLMPSVRWPVYGWLRGEVFYQGMPVSWWANEIESLYQPMWVPVSVSIIRRTTWSVERHPSLWDKIRERLGLKNTAVPVMDTTLGGPLVDGDADALPLLLALVRNPSPKVRRLAISGLEAQGQKRPKVPPVVAGAIGEAVNDSDDEVQYDARAALRLLNLEAAANAGLVDP
ncbi:hypothetical protein AYO44_12125 [Planctomycetaceae bacterium SCGC AG-212-F19]|nr:hypothetical protein AYO44_12125 [Planctomycetaceae bacterium SCGC AG-212-F19]